MNNNVFAAVCFTLVLLIPAQTALGASDSTSGLLGATKQDMVICPQVFVGGTQLNSAAQSVNLGSSSCGSGYPGGGVGIAGSVVAGAFLPSCPSDHPYLGGLQEGWIADILIAGGASMTVTCCTTPQPQMYVTVGYSSATGQSTWQQGPFCP